MRRTALALIGAGSICCLTSVLPMVQAHAAAEPGSGFGSFSLSAAARGAEITVGEPSYCYTTVAGTNGCEGTVPESTATLAAGPTGRAVAAVAWPGGLAADAGSLLITASNGQIPPEVGQRLNDPVRAEVRTGQSPDTVSFDSIPGITMKASAKPTGTTSDAHVQGLDAAAAGSFGPVSASSSALLTGPSAAVSKATSSVSEIVIAGVVKIASVTSTAEATTDGKKATVKGSTKVVGATIANVPVSIDERGVTVQGSGIALTALTSTVNSALAQLGLVLRVSEPQGKPDGASVAYTSGSLVAVFRPDPTTLFSVVLGGASVTAKAGPAFSFTQPSIPPFNGTTGGTTGTAGTTTGGGSGGLSGVPGTTGSVPETTTGGSVPQPQTLTPELAASKGGLYGGVSPWLGGVGLAGVGLIAAGLKRLPDRVLVPVPPACPLEES